METWTEEDESIENINCVVNVSFDDSNSCGDDDGLDDLWDTDIEDEEDMTNNIFDPVQDVKRRYVAACKECNVIPVSYFIRNLPNVRMNLAHHGIGERGMKAVSFALMSNTHLTGLNLCDNFLGDTGVGYLCELLLENYYINEIDISENNLTSGGVQHLCSVLTRTDTVKRLALRGNSMDYKSAMFLSEMIQDNISLKKLNLSWNGFSDDGLYVLSEALKVNSTLECLDISSNRISHVGAGHLQKGLKENDGLIILKAGSNPLQQGTAFILQGIKENPNSTIQELDLTDVQVNSAFVSLLDIIQNSNPDLKVYHGGFSGCALAAAERPKPMKVLRAYIKKNQMRIFDVFNSLDKDKSLKISVTELVQGLQASGIPLRKDELFELVRSLDLNGDGEVDYKELVIGNKNMVKEERSEIKKSKAKDDRNKTLANDLRPSTPASPTPRLKSARSNHAGSPKGSRPVSRETPSRPRSNK